MPRDFADWTMTSPQINLQFFGSFRLTLGETEVEGVPKPAQALLAHLALAESRGIGRSEIAAHLWPDVDPERSEFYLRRCLSQLRDCLGAQQERLVSLPDRRIALDLTDGYCDLSQFEADSKRSDPDALCRAAGAYQGDFLLGHRSEWVVQARENYRGRYVTLLRQLSRAEESIGDFAAAEERLGLAVLADPLHDETCRDLMRLRRRRGDFAGLARAFRDHRVRLRNSVGLPPSRETADLYRELLAQAQVIAPNKHKSDDAEINMVGLPAPTEPFLGRIKEQLALAKAVRDHRLVTLIGIGGVGKSRLAIQVGREAGPFCGRVAYADLTACAEAEEVVVRIAHALGLPDGARPGSAAAEALAPGRAFQTEQTLLLLDGAEQFAGACADAVQEFLAASDQLHVLCTSQVALRLVTERVITLEPMGLPTDPDHASANETGQDPREAEAVDFFLACAKRVAPEFQMRPQDIELVADLCRRLDGLPLALELAAVRLRALSIRDILANLDNRFRLLDPGREYRGRPKTLEGVLDWSFRLLPAPERHLFVSLTIFPTTWMAPAAQRICSGDELSEKQIAPALANLVDHSLVLFDPATGSYRMLETVRSYGKEKLMADGEAWPSLQSRHAEYFFQWARDGSNRDDESFLREGTNFAFAINTLLASDSREGRLRAVQLANRIFPSRLRTSNVAEGLRTALRLIEAFRDDQDEALAELHFRAASAASWLFKLELANVLFEQAESMADRLGLDAWTVESLRERGVLAANSGRLDDAEQLLGHALARYKVAEDPLAQAVCLGELGYIKRQRMEFDAARDLTESALALNTRYDNPDGRLWCLGSLAAINLAAGAPERAAPQLLEILRLQEAAANVAAQAWNLTMLGVTYVQMERFNEAEAFFERALRLPGHREDDLRKAWPMIELGELYRRSGRLQEAESVLTEALKLCRVGGSKALEASALTRLCMIAFDFGAMSRARALRATAADALAAIQAPQVQEDLDAISAKIDAADPQPPLTGVGDRVDVR